MLRDAQHATCVFMIRSFRHKGLRRFHETGSIAISVNGNWRLTFEFENGNGPVPDCEDYHR